VTKTETCKHKVKSNSNVCSQLSTSQQAQIHHQHFHCRNITTLQGCHPLYQRKSSFSHFLLAFVSGYFPVDASVAELRTMCVYRV
jgi:hypothetical protein